jgi:hypothetical protein
LTWTWTRGQCCHLPLSSHTAGPRPSISRAAPAASAPARRRRPMGLSRRRRRGASQWGAARPHRETRPRECSRFRAARAPARARPSPPPPAPCPTLHPHSTPAHCSAPPPPFSSVWPATRTATPTAAPRTPAHPHPAPRTPQGAPRTTHPAPPPYARPRPEQEHPSLDLAQVLAQAGSDQGRRLDLTHRTSGGRGK